jgi:hypothetical protein
MRSHSWVFDPDYFAEKMLQQSFCFGSGGSDNGGGGGNDSPAPVTNPTTERGRGAEPPAATGRNFTQASSNNQSNRDDNSPRDTMMDVVTLGNPAANTRNNQISQRDEAEIQRFVEGMAADPAPQQVLNRDAATALQLQMMGGLPDELSFNTPFNSAGEDDGLSTPSVVSNIPTAPVRKPPQRPIVGTPEMGFTDMMLSGAQRPNPAGFQARYGAEAPNVEAYVGADGGFQVPSVLRALGVKTARDHLMSGTGQPVYYPGTDEIAGTFSIGPFGGVVYSGDQFEGGDGPYQSLTSPPPKQEGGADTFVSPQVNPLTGTEQCPDGYEFDEDLQACKMKSDRTTTAAATDGERFYRATTLDAAPVNTPAGFDFAAANRNFVNSFAYNPLNYRKPMDLTGFSKVSGLL